MLIATVIASAFSPLCVQAETIDANQACQIASDFLSSANGHKRTTVTVADMSLRYTGLSSIDLVMPTYYIVANDRDGGWVVIAANDNVWPILGYCEDGYFDFEQLPCNMRAWLNGYSEQIEFIQAHPEIEPSQTKRQLISTLASITPMLTTTWGQGSPYNGHGCL